MNLSYTLDDIDVATSILIKKYIEDYKIWLFRGDLGAGKTTLIKSLCLNLGVNDWISSPTFVIIHEYESPRIESIIHMDCYRLKSIAEALQIGVEDYLYSGHLCMIEWPDVIQELFPEKTLVLNLSVISNTDRSISIKEKI